ncbi:MAG: ligand-binding sensor domain-containing protein [bacterium]
MRQITTLWALSLIAVVFSSCVSFNPQINNIEQIKSNDKSNNKITQVTNNHKEPIITQSVLISNNVRDVSGDNKYIWVATDKGVSMFDREKNIWTHFTKEDGLGSDNINAVAIDGRWVWFGTDDGVSRYDISNNEWRTFKSKDGLKGSKVYCISVEDDYVWFGTDGGLNRYDKNINSWAARTKKDGLSDDRVSAISITGDYMWVGTLWSGVNRYDKTTDSWNTYSKKDGLIDTDITAIAATENFIWFGTKKSGISLYDRTNQTFVKNYTKTDLLSSNDIRAITVDGNHVWIGTANGGVHRYIGVVDTWVRYTKNDGLTSNNITCIKISGNEVWFGSYDSGLTMYNKVTGKWSQFTMADTIPSDDINDVVKDSNGNLWIATAKGLAMYSSEKDEWVRYGKESGLTTEFITTIAANEKQIWVGTSRGLASFNNQTKNWEYYTSSNGLAHDFITSVEITDHKVWIGTNKGLAYMDTSKNKLDCICIEELKNEKITSITDNDNVLWVGTENGLWKYDITADKSFHYTAEHGLAGKFINTVLCWENSNVWVGTSDGIFSYDIINNKFVRINTEPVFDSNSNILTMGYDKGKIWIGKPDGLACFDTIANQWIDFNEKNIDGISKRPVRKIYVNGERIWLGTASGLVEYIPSNNNWKEHRSLMTREPFREADVSNIEFDGDYVWMSNWDNSRNGAIVRFDRKTNSWQWFSRENILKDMNAESMADVRRIIVDKDAVWFATNYGILRYDKLKDIWEHFTKEDGLIDNNIGYITCGNTVVWVSYWSSPKLTGAQISKYDKILKTWTTVDIENLIFPRESVNVIAADGDDVWVGVGSSGIRKISKDGKQTLYTKEDGLAQNIVDSIAVDGNEIWFGHRAGWSGGSLTRYNKITGEWHKYSSNDVLAGDGIERIFPTDRYIWIIYNSGIAAITAYDKKMNSWNTIEPNPSQRWRAGIEDIAEDGDYLWIGTDGDWVKRFHLPSGTWTTFDYKSGLLMDDVNDFGLNVDERYVWVGTRRGLSRYDKLTESWTNFMKCNSLADDKVYSIAIDDRYIWCGTANGLSRYDKTYGTWKNYFRTIEYYYTENENYSRDEWVKIREERRNSLINNYVSALAVDNRYLWVGTREGANRYDKVTDKWDRFEKENGLPGLDISSIVVDGYDVWMGTNAGLCKFPSMSDNLNAWVSYTSGIEIRQTAMTKEYATTLVSNEVWSIDVDQEYVWIGTMRGISRYDKKKDLWTTFTIEDGLPSNEIGSVKVDGDIVWFGCGEGIIAYDKKNNDWFNFSTKDGLNSNKITAIARDDEYVWFGTFDAGIIRYSKSTKKWDSFTRKDGLSHNTVLSIAVDGNQVWIGTQKGLSRYDKINKTWTVFTKHFDSEDI